MIMREIVTIQVGGFANFIGSHFWNFHYEMLGLVADPYGNPLFKTQSLNMDVLYCTVESYLYSSRILSIDFQESLGSMSLQGTLYHEGFNASFEVVTWKGNVSTHTFEPQKKNLFFQSLYQEVQNVPLMNGGTKDSPNETEDIDIINCLDKGVQFWIDFSKVHYHPQSLCEVNGLWMDAQEFDNYGIGTDVFTGNLRGEEICDRLRFFVEECDCIQGFQFIVDDSGGFSHVASDFLESIADEYTNTPVLRYVVKGPGSYMNLRSRKQTVVRDLHDAISFSRLSSFCKMIVPVGLHFLSKRRQEEQSLLGNLQPLTPKVAEDVDDLQAVESMTVHGAFGSEGHRASVCEVKNTIHGAYDRAITRPMFCHLSVARCPLPIPLPFHSIFRKLIGQHGELLGRPILGFVSRGSLDVHSLPMATRLRSSCAILPFLENRLGNLRKFGIERGSLGAELLRSWGFGKDEVEDFGEMLSKMVRTVNNHSKISSDSE